MTSILLQLKAEALLHDTGIIEKVKSLRDSMMYRAGDTTYTFEDYYNHLLRQSEQIEQIQLLSAVPPGTAQKYLVDLTQAFQEVMDKIEAIQNRALFFIGKVRAAMHNRDTLKAAFTVWYQVAMTEAVENTKFNFTAKTQAGLAASEFARLFDDDGELEGLESALDMLIDHLKSAKMLAKEKYKIGTDQANSSIIKTPNMGLHEGDPFPLLRQRYDLKDKPPAAPHPQYDDEEEEGGLPVDDDPQYVEHREIQSHEIDDKLMKSIEAPVEVAEVAVVTAEELPAAAAEWREGIVDAVEPDNELPAGYKSWREVSAEADEVIKAKPKVQFDDDDEIPSPPPAKIIDDPFIGEVKITKDKDGNPSVTKAKGGKFDDFEDDPAPAKGTKAAKPKYDDEEEETPAPPASAPSPATPKPVKKDRKKILFDDPPF